MPRPRMSRAQAALTGALERHPERYRDRVEPASDGDLGKPPAHLTDAERIAWRELSSQAPWLNKSHRGITAIAAHLQARLVGGDPSHQAMNLLRLCLGQMGLVPGAKI